MLGVRGGIPRAPGQAVAAAAAACADCVVLAVGVGQMQIQSCNEGSISYLNGTEIRIHL